MRYRIVQTETTVELENQVNALLDEGWKCQGGMYVDADYDDPEYTVFNYYQAMIFPTTAPPPVKRVENK